MDAERQQLLTLWSREWGAVKRGPEWHLFPVKWIDRVSSVALQHTGLLQSMLATAAFMSALATDSGMESAVRHTQQAIDVLFQTAVSSQNPASDEHILGLICLMLVHLAQGSGYEVEKQYSAIVQMVSTRGGPHYLGLSGIVAELLLHADATQAVYFNRCPTFEMLLPALKIGVNPQSGAGFRSLSPRHGLAPDLLAAIDSLCRTVDIFRLLITDDVDRTGAINSFGYLSTVSGFQLALCHNATYESYGWSELVCLALLLFNHTVLHSHGTIDAITQRLEQRFWTAMDITLDRHGFGQLPRPLILWTMLTGLTPSIYVTSKYKMNAMGKMRAASAGMAIDSWHEFRNLVLDPFVWIPMAQEETFHLLWLELVET